MLLAEEFLLLAFDPEAGRPPLGKGDALKPGLCGALLSELALCGKVALVGEDVRVVDAHPTGDLLLDEVLRLLGADGHRRRKVKGQVKALARGLGNVRDRVAARLVNAGVLAEERSRAAGIVPVTRYPVLDRDTHRRLREDVRSWIAGPSSGDARLATLVALLGACQLLGPISEDRAEERRAAARARAVISDVPTAGAVKAIVDDVRTVAAAVAVLHG